MIKTKINRNPWKNKVSVSPQVENEKFSISRKTERKNSTGSVSTTALTISTFGGSEHWFPEREHDDTDGIREN